MTDTPTVQRINELLAEVYTEEGCRIWWQSRNRNLHGSSPEDLFNTGGDYGREKVLAEAERLAGGAW